MSDTAAQKNQEKLARIRHSVSHVMAQAVTRLFPGTKVAIGPSIENGFYYDFQFPPPATDRRPWRRAIWPRWKRK